MIEISDETRNLLQELSRLTLESISADEFNNISKTFSSMVSSLIDTDTMKRISGSASQSLRDVFANVAAKIASDSLEQFSKLHWDTLVQLNQINQTKMVKELTGHIMSAQYESVADVINKALSESMIKGSDIAFLKTSELTQIFREQLEYPRGVASVIRDLNKSTAEDIANNDEIEFSTENNRFINKSGNDVDVNGLNVISSVKHVFYDAADELFTEEELIDFNVLLARTPMLGMTSETGRRIHQLIKDLFISGEKTIDFDHQQYFHCRARKKNTMPYVFEDMLKAPNGIPGIGRYNHADRSHYYFSDTREGADNEIKSIERKMKFCRL